ncbi:MAG: AbrB/MazE/SpoVT family DNA-binding domain-containing protein [Methylomonas sp.]|jgi:antitoxin MazE
MQTEIKKWGNSAVVRLPATMLAQLKLEVGSTVELTADEIGFRIVPSTTKAGIQIGRFAGGNYR